MPALRRMTILLTAFMVLNSADKAESLVFSFGYGNASAQSCLRTKELRRFLGRAIREEHAHENFRLGGNQKNRTGSRPVIGKTQRTSPGSFRVPAKAPAIEQPPCRCSIEKPLRRRDVTFASRLGPR